MGIERDLHDLLHCHDCVIVPQWGGFLAHYRPARLDDARKLIHPPGKDISFNRHLVRNDGLLADHVAKREGIAFDQASALIDQEVSGWRQALNRHGRLELERIGIFYRDAEHNLQFDPDRRASFLKEAFGLRPWPAIPVEAVRPAAQRRDAPPATPLPATEARPRHPAYWAAAAIAALLIASAAVLAYNASMRKGGPLQGLAGWDARPAAAYQPPEEAGFAPVRTPQPVALPEEGSGVHEVLIDTERDVRLLVDMGRPATAAADTTRVAMPALAPASGGGELRYHVIGGCFAQPENADRMLSDLLAQGFPARRLPIRGVLHPVAYGSYATRDEALAALASVRSSGGRSAWLLKR
ncbi:MAG: SPOR domain-containing protein [Flavobacteriales bacterium]